MSAVVGGALLSSQDKPGWIYTCRIARGGSDYRHVGDDTLARGSSGARSRSHHAVLEQHPANDARRVKLRKCERAISLERRI